MQNSLNITTVGIVGTGLIGASWATYFLSKGFKVVATDPAPNAEEKLNSFVTTAWEKLAQENLIDLSASLDHLTFCSDMQAALVEVDFVQESAPENLAFKIELMQKISQIVRPDVIIASSSSGLMVSDFQINATHPERIVLGHPFNPPHIIPLVEVVGGQLTDKKIVDNTLQFYQEIGKTPVRLNKEIKGHIANRLQFALFREVMYLLENDVASVADIDKALTEGPGLRWALLGQFMNSSLGGGEGGFPHMMVHLGGAIEEWWADLGKIETINPETVKKVENQLADTFAHHQRADIVQARDKLILEMVRAKDAVRQTGQLP